MSRNWTILLRYVGAATIMTAGLGLFRSQAQTLPAKDLVVRLDTQQVIVRPVVLRQGGERFRDVVKRLGPHAAINGTYYDKQFRPMGDIVANGKLLNRGRYPSAFVVRKNGQAAIIWRKDASFASGGYRAAIAAGPRLVRSGMELSCW